MKNDNGITDNLSEFLEEMGDVKKINQDKVVTDSTQEQLQINVNNRQKAALKNEDKYLNFLTDGDVEQVEPSTVLNYKISGIQPNVFKNLKAAKYKFDFHLDLHRMTVAEARNAVFRLISSADVEDFRCFLVTHGKGERSQQPAKLKSYVNHWLRQVQQVVAFHSALPRHGGAGSTYVLLKKPKQKRKINQVKYE
jgi:DNA-nicking Smr family endonuclease